MCLNEAEARVLGVVVIVWGCGGLSSDPGGAYEAWRAFEPSRKFTVALTSIVNPQLSLQRVQARQSHIPTMSREKRPAADAFGTSQLVKRAKSDANLGGSNAVAVVNQSSQNGALIQSVCLHNERSWLRC